MRFRVLLSIFLCLGALAQERPQKACSFDGFSADPKLAEVTKATVGYFGCLMAKDCRPAKLAAGEALMPYNSDGDWTCAYLQQRDGAGPGWVRPQDIRAVPADPAPPLDAWSGTWVNRGDHIRIVASKASGKLHLEGDAKWHGIADVVHYGKFAGAATPVGNHLHFVDDPCIVDLTLIGKFLVANDNNQCGGMNVRFLGLWTRSAK